MLRVCALFVLLLLPLTGVAGPSGPVRVIDADTWDVGDTRVRLFGIDAPELAQTCQNRQGLEWSCGAWATDRARARFEGRVAACEQIDTDRYGRTIARCSVDGEDAGRIMVLDGLALAFRRYSSDYDLDEKAAHVRGVGIHGGSVEAPAAFRAASSRSAAPEACVIKGNISASGERIYHLPGQEHYARTRISPAKGERWFCYEAAARAAGWRRARR